MTFEDTFSKCITTKEATVSKLTAVRMLKDIDKVVYTQKDDDITFHWKLIKLTDLNNNEIG